MLDEDFLNDVKAQGVRTPDSIIRRPKRLRAKHSVECN